jgi:hypothetical protein
MYSVIRFEFENLDIQKIASIANLLDEKDFDINDDIHSFDLSNEPSPYSHFEEIEAKILNLTKSIDLSNVNTSVDVSVDCEDLKNRNMWCMELPLSLGKRFSENNIKLEVTIYP